MKLPTILFAISAMMAIFVARTTQAGFYKEVPKVQTDQISSQRIASVPNSAISKTQHDV
ncbi:hypothetical protein J1N35_045695 [Gossypium stocksii]|uniref:Uncharacterized protein n=1 Tax=Gossypium stocksii TaxID=47602 RepID=A0A9D3UBH4_9ROSI|nr:hypothetical protein J1N35_045695 [Gossypium stocksii]